GRRRGCAGVPVPGRDPPGASHRRTVRRSLTHGRRGTARRIPQGAPDRRRSLRQTGEEDGGHRHVDSAPEPLRFPPSQESRTHGNSMATIVQTTGAAHLECTACGKTYESEKLWRLSPCCEKPLYARYDLERLRETFRPSTLAGRPATLWRYAEVLPVRDPARRLSLGEGFTPLIDAPRLADALGVERIWIKDEGQNPTASFKARGLALAVARAWELGVSEVAIPTAGNAGSATAAYAAAAGLVAHVVAPADTPRPILEEIEALGAHLELVNGLITDAARRVAEGARDHGWFDLSTLREPYRVEGKKTMGYELFEQLGGRLPDVIIYPTGGGTGLVGMWKAFDEMERLGWIGPERP